MGLLDALISYWKLDEAGGPRLDSHGANHLNDVNTVGSAPGKIGNAASFVSADAEFLSRASNPTLQTGDVDFTLAGWARLTSVVAFSMLVSHGTDGFQLLRFSTASRLQVRIGADGLGVTSAATFPEDAWFFWCFWHDAANNVAGIQIDAQAPDTASMIHPGGTSDRALNFNGRFDGALCGDMLLDGVGFWKRVLTAEERASLYNAGNGLDYPFTQGDVEAAIVSRLTTDPAVAAIIVDRIAQAGMPQGLARPNIVYQRLSTRREYSNDGPTRSPHATIQLTCWADDTAGARTLSKSVREALDGFRGTVAGLVIDAIFLSDEHDAPVPKTPGVDQAIRGVVFDCTVHYRE